MPFFLLLLHRMHTIHCHTSHHPFVLHNTEIHIPAPHPHPRTKKVNHIWNDGSADANESKDTECPRTCDGSKILQDDQGNNACEQYARDRCCGESGEGTGGWICVEEVGYDAD